MSLKKIKAVNRVSLLHHLGYHDTKKIMYIVYKLESSKKYTEFTVEKSNKELRKIATPTDSLKRLQKKLMLFLQDCYFEIEELKKYKVNYNDKKNKPIFFNAHGFLTNRSIITNALKHKNKRYVLNIDLKDFFPSINFARVYGFFNKNKYFKLSKEVSAFIAHIVCFNGKLPQGTPTSPIISNLLTMNLDSSLNILSSKYKLTYTRYADDITFSTNLRDFPKDIAYINENNEWKLGETLINIVKRNYFEVNDSKTRMQYKTSRQEVTGLIVNRKVNIKRKYIREVRAAIYNFNENTYLHSKIRDDKQSENDRIEEKKYKINQIKSKISFIYQVRKNLLNEIEKNKKNKPKKDEEENTKKERNNIKINDISYKL